MKFKQTIKILTEHGKLKEIKGTVIPFKEGIVNIEVMAHPSEAPWKPEAIEVSEKSTGCRLFTASKTAEELKPADVIAETSEFIKMHGKKVFLAQIDQQINNNPHIYLTNN